jgi:hypothetical protein
VFLVKDLFSAEEAAHIVSVGSPKVARSMTGQADSAYESETRTSKTGWVMRLPFTPTIHAHTHVVVLSSERLFSHFLVCVSFPF